MTRLKKKKLITLKGKTNLFKSVFKLIAKAYTEEVCKAEGNDNITLYDVTFVYYKTCDMVYNIINEYSNEIADAGLNASYEVSLDLGSRKIIFKVISGKGEIAVDDDFDYGFMYFPEDAELIAIIHNKVEDEMVDVEYWLEDESKFVKEVDWKPCKSLLDSIDKFRACLKETLKNTLKGE